MEIVIHNVAFNKLEILGNTDTGTPIPRIGDHIDIWWSPLPKVTSVCWRYAEKQVIVYVD